MTEKRERCIKKEMEIERKIKDGKTEIKDGWGEREKIVPGIQTKKDGEIENINRDREKRWYR